MKKYEVIGYEQRTGISRKNNKPYDGQILHVKDCDTLITEPSFGNRVESVYFNRNMGYGFSDIPVVGDCINIFYNSQGFAVDIRIL